MTVRRAAPRKGDASVELLEKRVRALQLLHEMGRRITSLLAPGGVVYLETPNVGSLDAKIWKQRWGLIHFPRHLYLFDRQTVRRLIESSGLETEAVRWEPNSCGWALSVQSELRRHGIDRSRTPRSRYYPLLLLAFLPMNLLDAAFGGTAFMSAIGRKSRT